MIPDNDTNLLYLADSLPQKQPMFFQRFEKVLYRYAIDYQFLPGTKDIWAVDYMPVQVSKNNFVQFHYNPTYLKRKKDQKTISDVDSICKTIKVSTKKSPIVLDGGNVIRSTDKVIMCDKVFSENPDIPEKELIKQLKCALEVEYLYFIPWDTSDFTGHADGMVRFVDNQNVLINNYSKEKPEYQRAFRMSLHNAGLAWIELPYNPYNNKSHISAEGTYLNYLQMKQAIVVPTFNRKEDELAVKIMEQHFKGQTIEAVACAEIAKEGGILNCISWNILKE